MGSTALAVLATTLLAAAALPPANAATQEVTAASVTANKSGGTTINITMDKSGKPVVDADEQQVLEGLKMIQAGQILAAIDGPINAVINKYEAKYGQHPKDTYSARGATDALLYAGIGAKDKRNVVVLGPAWAMAYWARGYAYGEMNRYDDEQAELEKALALAPFDAQYSNELAYVLMQKRDWNGAMEHYRAGQEYAPLTAADGVTPMQCAALRGQGYVLVELHRLDEAEAKYRECLTLIPGEPKSLGEIGYIHEQKKKLEQAH
ncbi:tetratricopeptide repeat protein [Dyella telluris]|uniref:Tetratricopeptide repeat protein n=1 Tax=Dyella telluris TaxID=2763498 RepID=A0A7G8Q0Z6_9GAMM|nr:tetratricopeptide repeat protein [Dyella telluris]QNK00454.1 tetratricopeptide repeat protein [Dyella telluris]